MSVGCEGETILFSHSFFPPTRFRLPQCSANTGDFFFVRPNLHFSASPTATLIFTQIKSRPPYSHFKGSTSNANFRRQIYPAFFLKSLRRALRAAHGDFWRSLPFRFVKMNIRHPVATSPHPLIFILQLHSQLFTRTPLFAPETPLFERSHQNMIKDPPRLNVSQRALKMRL